MNKRTIMEWAAIAEIVGTVAVVISLIFVVYSIRQNTEELRLQNSNYLYDMQNAALETMVSEPLLLDVLAKVEESDNLSSIEQMRLVAFLFQVVNRWEQAYWWHQSGLISDEDWHDWEQVFRINATTWMPLEIWEEMRPSYSEEFALHVEEFLAHGE